MHCIHCQICTSYNLPRRFYMRVTSVCWLPPPLPCSSPPPPSPRSPLPSPSTPSAPRPPKMLLKCLRENFPQLRSNPRIPFSESQQITLLPTCRCNSCFSTCLHLNLLPPCHPLPRQSRWGTFFRHLNLSQCAGADQVSDASHRGVCEEKPLDDSRLFQRAN